VLSNSPDKQGVPPFGSDPFKVVIPDSELAGLDGAFISFDNVAEWAALEEASSDIRRL